ncbi:FAD-binding oxidoreductase [Wenxinia marina]|uniref:Flavodoxin reductase (Ferredoxin-NADPH reductase) family 1 n=1 Tax=Wenxinia marina DSM 24838 TaxID=1123501 RepID=A0A0D0Q5S2_9RHOB|nr:FAD-binding oxidoreductase [Wenxinia marina]KIQ67837.1 Flavodoxin reductase (ferredoxin-NADPH reductase) family 1 [Wenxinia marina DSM 24838]GGL74653.1 hypothetical protein GCM10011392_31610 [Wenxinia marina]
MAHTLTLQSVAPVTHDTHHLIFDRPEGYSWTPGQATLLSLDQEGWRDEKRPFTFVSSPDARTVEFVIKSYPDHDGVTKRIAQLSPGDTVIVRSTWGAIEDRGPGTFLAGGAGITPFIGILRERARQGGAGGSTLIFSNATEKDIILRQEWEGMEGLRTVFTLTEEEVPGLEHGQIDGPFLDRHVTDWDGVFYVCGPRKMEDTLIEVLKGRGVPSQRIISEDHPD